LEKPQFSRVVGDTFSVIFGLTLMKVSAFAEPVLFVLSLRRPERRDGRMRRTVLILSTCLMFIVIGGCGSGGDGKLSSDQQKYYEETSKKMMQGAPAMMPAQGGQGPQTPAGKQQNPYGAGYPGGS
jgi:hypothetical protein